MECQNNAPSLEDTMTHNLNTTDRIVRTGLGVALVAVAIAADVDPISSVVLYVLAAVMLGTAAIAFCPLYSALGISTCPAPHRTRREHVGASRSN